MFKVGDKVKLLSLEEIIKRNLIRDRSRSEYQNSVAPYGIPIKEIKLCIGKTFKIIGTRASFGNKNNLDFIIDNYKTGITGYAWPSNWFIGVDEQYELEF